MFKLGFPLAGIFFCFLLTADSCAQYWQQNDLIFNPSGIPSVSFSQPRFADLDADGDLDLILGSIDEPPLYFKNTGTSTEPAFQAGPDLFAGISSLDAEVGVCADLDADGDLDLVTGGYTGLHFFENTGDSALARFAEVEDFFAGLSSYAYPIPTLADLDADGDLDLLLGLSESGQLIFFSNGGDPDSAAFLQSQSQIWYDVGLYAYPWLADLDNDGDVDLLTGRDATRFYYYRNIGDSTFWQWQSDNSVFAGLASATYWNSPCLVDLSGDGRKDLIYGTANGPLNYYVNTGSDLSPAWTEQFSLFGGVLDAGGASSPFLFDLDGDGDLDLISGSQLGAIKCFRNVGTVQAPAWEPDHAPFRSIDHSIYSSISLGDVNGDSLADAVVGDLSGQLFFHRNTGSGFIHDTAVFEDIDLGDTSVPRLVDMDGDGDLDLVAGNENGLLFFFQNSGTPDSADWQEIPGFFEGIDVGSHCSPTLGDFDSDGDIDLFTGDLFREVQFFENIDGAWVEDPPQTDGVLAGQNAAPALGDIDGDGDLDLAVGNYDGTFNYFENIRSTFAPLAGDESCPTGFRLAAAHPNPFNSSTTLSGAAPEAGQVEVRIFNILGQQVYLRTIDLLAAGRFTLRVDLPDHSAAGIYPYVVIYYGRPGLFRHHGKLVYLR